MRSPVTRSTSLLDGDERTPSRREWARLDLVHAWVDAGPSPAGNAGPYLHAPTTDDSLEHRVYPRRWAVGMRVEREGTSWAWVYPEACARCCDTGRVGGVVCSCDAGARALVAVGVQCREGGR